MKLSFAEIAGMWMAVGFTLFMFSFLYKDNPFYKAGEHLYVGITIGYGIVVTIFDSWVPKVWHVIHPEAGVWCERSDWWLLFFPVSLGVLMLTRFVPKYAWLSRWTFAFVVGYAAGIAIPATFATSIQNQAKATVAPLASVAPGVEESKKSLENAQAEADKVTKEKGDASDESYEARERVADAKARFDAATAARAKSWASTSAATKAEEAAVQARQKSDEAVKNSPAGSEAVLTAEKAAHDAEQLAIRRRLAAWDAYSRTDYSFLGLYRDLSTLILFLGVASVLFYFFFSIENKGPVRVISRIGILFLMVYFGASYGATVMGRLSLLYGRLVIVKDGCLPKYGLATPILLAIMIAVLATLHFKNKGQDEQA